MPIWLFFLLVTCAIVGIAYCLALWNANRDCRNCRIAFFAVGEVAGCWLLIKGLSEENDKQVTFGTILLVVVSLWFGARWLSSWLDKKKAQRENIQRERSQEGPGVAAAAAAVAVAAGADAASPDARKTGSDKEGGPETEGGDADADLDIGLDL